MAQWKELLRLNLVQGRLDHLYEGKFPRHIRHCLCYFIESQDWVSAAVDRNKASACFQALLLHVDQQWEPSVQESFVLQGPDYPGMKDYLLRHFKDEPLKLAVILSECLQEEKKALASAFENQEGEKEINSLEGLYENHQQQSKQMELMKMLAEAKQVVSALLDVELPQWKRRQQMECIGSPADTGLDHLQKGFTAVADVLLQIRRQCKKYNNPDASGCHGDAEKSAESLLTKLLASALVVEKQPVMSHFPKRPLILKTGNHFTASVRFLANLPEFKYRLKVQPVFDKDVKETMMNGWRQFDFNMGNSRMLDVRTPGGGLVAEFEQMLIQEKKGRGKGSREGRLGVSEELHIIKFVAGLQFEGLSCDLEACSLPVVVISATNQVSSAWASVLWCSVLSSGEPRNLLLLADPPPLTWQQLSQVLSWQFLSVGGRGLDENQLSVLRDKIVDNHDGVVHWAHFKSENVWTWIDGILDLIKRHLVDLWRDGYIMGFVSRMTTELLLQEKPTGTFVLRFSESNKDGAITFSWVEHVNGEAQVHAVDPYTKTDLQRMSLPDNICQYSLRVQGTMTRNPLLHLYPDIPREAAFRHYCSGEKMDKNGYLPRYSIPLSDYPTPPQSPPGHMDLDPDPSTEDFQLLQEFLDQTDSPGPHHFWAQQVDDVLTQAEFPDPSF